MEGMAVMIDVVGVVEQKGVVEIDGSIYLVAVDGKNVIAVEGVAAAVEGVATAVEGVVVH